MDVHNVEDAGLTPAEQKDMQSAWAVNSAAVGEAVLAKGGFAVPYFIGMPRNVRLGLGLRLRLSCIVLCSPLMPGVFNCVWLCRRPIRSQSARRTWRRFAKSMRQQAGRTSTTRRSCSSLRG